MSVPFMLWQPADKLPYEGVTVLVWAPSRDEPSLAYLSLAPSWAEGDFWWRHADTGVPLDWEPTHWMPLPPPPGGAE